MKIVTGAEAPPALRNTVIDHNVGNICGTSCLLGSDQESSYSDNFFGGGGEGSAPSSTSWGLQPPSC